MMAALTGEISEKPPVEVALGIGLSLPGKSEKIMEVDRLNRDRFFLSNKKGPLNINGPFFVAVRDHPHTDNW